MLWPGCYKDLGCLSHLQGRWRRVRCGETCPSTRASRCILTCWLPRHRQYSRRWRFATVRIGMILLVTNFMPMSATSQAISTASRATGTQRHGIDIQVPKCPGKSVDDEALRHASLDQSTGARPLCPPWPTRIIKHSRPAHVPIRKSAPLHRRDTKRSHRLTGQRDTERQRRGE